MGSLLPAYAIAWPIFNQKVERRHTPRIDYADDASRLRMSLGDDASLDGGLQDAEGQFVIAAGVGNF